MGFGAIGLPTGLSVNSSTGLISGTFTSSGTDAVVITADNAYGTGYSYVVITSVLGPPVITSAPAATGTAGQPFGYQITAIGNASSYTATGLPPGLSIDPLAGAIGGTPTLGGTFAATITAINTSGTGAAPLSITIMASFGGWQNQWFTPTQMADPSIAGDTADPAGDGIPNLIKYALGLDPWTDGSQGLPACGMVTIGNFNYLTLTYTQQIFGNDLNYLPEVSVDLQNWYSGPTYIVPVTITPNPDGVTETVTVRYLTPMGSTPAFMHLKVTGP